VSSNIELIGTKMATDISGRAAQAEAIVGGLSRQLDEQVSLQVNSMESRLQSALIEISAAVEDTTERARTVLSGAGSDNLATLDGRLEHITSLIDSRLSDVDAVVGEKGDRMISALETHTSG